MSRSSGRSLAVAPSRYIQELVEEVFQYQECPPFRHIASMQSSLSKIVERSGYVRTLLLNTGVEPSNGDTPT